MIQIEEVEGGLTINRMKERRKQWRCEGSI